MSEVIDDVFRYMQKAEYLRNLLAKFEWSGHARGQGSGPMGSGGDGYSYPACPLCRGIHPSGKSEFVESALGHRKDCELFIAINGGPNVRQG